MSASQLPPPAQGREGGSDRVPCGGTPTRPAWKSLLVGSLLATVLTGCNNDKGGVIQPVATGSSPTASASPTPATEQQAILGQYRTFWASLTPVSRMPATQRRAALAPYTIDPELKSLVAGMANISAKGQVFYGAHRPRATQASLSSDGKTAVINDCQDSTKTGLARRSDMAPLTRGVVRNHVVVTMKKVAGVWKVYFVSHTNTPC